MGTAFDAANIADEYIGIVPRAVEQIFDGMEKRRATALSNGVPVPNFDVEVQFVEVISSTRRRASTCTLPLQLYNEDLIDLLSVDRNHNVRIQEEADSGQIVLKNATTLAANSASTVVETLKSGALNRTTGSTNMNQQSSRSHAIFSVHVKQEKFDVRLHLPVR